MPERQCRIGLPKPGVAATLSTEHDALDSPASCPSTANATVTTAVRGSKAGRCVPARNPIAAFHREALAGAESSSKLRAV
jgi:hypothetical protein